MAFRKFRPIAHPQILRGFSRRGDSGGRISDSRKGLAGADAAHVRFGDVPAPIVIGSDSYVIARVPEGVARRTMFAGRGHRRRSVPWTCHIGIRIADRPAPGFQPRDRPQREHLHHLQWTRRAEDPGIDLQD